MGINKFSFLFFIFLTTLSLKLWAQTESSAKNGNKEPIQNQGQPLKNLNENIPLDAKSHYLEANFPKSHFSVGAGVSSFNSDGEATISFRDYETYAPTLNLSYVFASIYRRDKNNISGELGLSFSVINFNEQDQESASKDVQDIPLSINFRAPTLYNLTSFSSSVLSPSFKVEYYQSNLNNSEDFRDPSYTAGSIGLTLASNNSSLNGFRTSLYYSLLTDYSETTNLGKTIDSESIVELEMIFNISTIKQNLIADPSPYFISFNVKRLTIDYENSDDSILQTYTLSINRILDL